MFQHNPGSHSSFGGQNRSDSRYSPNRGGSNGSRQGSSSGYRSRPVHRIKTVDPRMLIKKAAEKPQVTAPYIPQNSFADFQVHEYLKKNIESHGYVTPTPIQDQAIPEILAGKDVVGIANTGTGKTAAFLIPVISKLQEDSTKKALIIVPTRELAVQILDEAKKFTPSLNVGTLLCIGGSSMFTQVQGLRRNPNIVIGTPGRLKDLSNQGKLLLSQYSIIILDEVDRMLDMGFIVDIRYIISRLASNRQSLFFSATLSPEIHGVMQMFLKDPKVISVKTSEHTANVDQDVVRTEGKAKIDVLHQILIRKEVSKTLVFGRTKWGIEKLAQELVVRGFKVESLHGNKSQGQRQRALDNFRRNKVNILLATDVASRGLDIDDISHVINFDLPESFEDYTHRIGRTGRANKKGVALSIIET